MKTTNEYADVIPNNVYGAMPKAVLAAIAVSLASADGRFDGAVAAILKEWDTLHVNGIVPQPVPSRLRNLIPSEPVAPEVES